MTPELLDCGAVIARRITALADASADPGAMYLRGLLWRIHQEVGDGTATAAAIFEAIYCEGRRAITAGVPAQRLRSRLDDAADRLGPAIDAQAQPLRDRKALTRAIVPDVELSELIADAIDRSGPFGPIDLRDAHGAKSRIELVEGAHWDAPQLSSAFLAASDATRIEAINPLILLSDLDIADPEPLIPILVRAIEERAGGVVIVAKSISTPAAAFLARNHRPDSFAIVAVRTPGVGEIEQRHALDDLAVITGARPLFASSGSTISPGDLGRTRRAWATKTHLGLHGGGGDAANLRDHHRKLVEALDAAEPADCDAVLKRLAPFHRGSVSLFIGGATAPEQKQRQEAAERAISVLQRSLRSGVVPGGGAALIHALSAMPNETDLESRWVQRIVRAGLEAPLRAIAANCGFEPSTVAARARESAFDRGFDARGGQFIDCFGSGLVDPVDVVRESAIRTLRAAALALTIDVIVHTRRDGVSIDPE
jgi:chaperonin GroEL